VFQFSSLPKIELKADPYLACIRFFSEAYIDQEDKTDSPEASLINLDTVELVASIKQYLNSKGILQGVDEKALQYFVEETPQNWTEVAWAQLPEQGQDGWVDEILPLPRTPKPTLLENGSTDYKNLCWNRPVEEGGLIARLVAPTLGQNGIDIYGHTLEARKGKPAFLPAGAGTVIVAKGTELRAATQGFLYWREDLICVGQCMVIQGDVDYHTGNIKHSGELVIEGHVRSGFSVEASGTIIIHGHVEAARVWSREAHVEIRGGVFGKGKAEIHAHENLLLEFAQEAQLFAGAKLQFNKYLMNCQTFARGAIESIGGRGSVVGGETASYTEISVGYTGNIPSIPTILSIQTPEADQLNDRWGEFRRLEKEIHSAVLTLASRLKVKTDRGRLPKTDLERENLAKMTAEYKGLLLRLKMVEKRKTSVEEQLAALTVIQGTICIINQAHPGTEVVFLRQKKRIEELLQRPLFRFLNNDIILETREII